MLVAVTGGAGFLGTHVVRQLLREGQDVVVLVRQPRRARGLQEPGVKLVGGDLESPHALDPAFPGQAELLIHLAARYGEGPAERERLLRVNRDGTRKVLEAARRAGVPRVVHVSTMGTCTPALHGGPATEADWVAGGRNLSPYVASKLAGERVALEFPGLEVVVVNPAAPVGAYDWRPGVTGQRILDVLEGRFPRLLAGPVNYVSARGCAAGILLAARRGKPRRRYLLGGENLTPLAFLARLSEATGKPPPRRRLLDRLCRRRRLTPGRLDIDDSRARRELGFEPPDLDRAFQEAVAFFEEQKDRRSGRTSG